LFNESGENGEPSRPKGLLVEFVVKMGTGTGDAQDRSQSPFSKRLELKAGRHAQAAFGSPAEATAFVRRRLSYGGQPSLSRRLVEAPGVEPGSEDLQRTGSTCVADRFGFAAAHAHRLA